MTEMERVVEEVQKAGIIMVDTEPVIRCKDCRYVWIRGDRLFCERDGGFVEVTPTDFCSRGEVEQ